MNFLIKELIKFNILLLFNKQNKNFFMKNKYFLFYKINNYEIIFAKIIFFFE